MTRTTIVMAASLVLAVTLPAVSAQAQAIRTFVSTTGNDSNPCSITAPCRHFSAAVAVTAVDGEVDALESGAYGSFSIGQGITIEGEGWSYVAPPAGGAAITINAGSGVVNIRGVSLNGISVSNAFGIEFNSGATLNVQNSVIRNFTNGGIKFAQSSSGASQIFVSNTLISDNAGIGIDIVTSGSGTTTGALDSVKVENNGNDGLTINPDQTTNITLSDCVIANNTGDGIDAGGQNGIPMTLSVMVRNSTIVNNRKIGLEAFSGNTTIRVTRSTITGNNVGWSNDGGAGAVLSYADNNIDTNLTGGNTAPPTTGLVYK
jgi:Right handed beta helix region